VQWQKNAHCQEEWCRLAFSPATSLRRHRIIVQIAQNRTRALLFMRRRACRLSAASKLYIPTAVSSVGRVSQCDGSSPFNSKPAIAGNIHILCAGGLMEALPADATCAGITYATIVTGPGRRLRSSGAVRSRPACLSEQTWINYLRLHI
jgi:hypothetical protein